MDLPRVGPRLAEKRPGNGVSGRGKTALIGGLIVVVGLVVSTFLAAEWRSNVLRTNRESFRSAASNLGAALASRLDTSIALTRTMRSIVAMEPGVDDTRFDRWYRQLEHGMAAPSGEATVLIQPIAASRLPTFRRQAEGDPEFRALLGGRFQIVPPGKRPIYCLTRAIGGRSAATSLYPPLLDYCAPVLPGIGRSPFASLIRTATDTGSSIVTPIPGPSLVAIGEAVYRQGASPATVPARRAALTGLIGTSFDSDTLIRPLLTDHPSLALALYHRNLGGPLQLIASAGSKPRERSGAPAYSERRELGAGWLVYVTGTPGGPISAKAQGLIVLGAGLLVSVLAFLLYRVLSRSRQRAWGLVGEKTDELEYRALHDPLTDLPNRSLILDRADQTLARARWMDVAVSALFVDVDGFKLINDRYGHKAGDEVLRKVGSRLKTVLRDSDSVGRVGGDEFVILVDPTGLNAAPELIAERALDVLRQPMELSPPPRSPVSVTASVGVATGSPPSAEELLQDADLAMHKAKALGKDGYALFESVMQMDARDRIQLEMDFAAALEADQLFIEYQPMLNLVSERPVGVEALLRWRHPTRGVIAPAVFVPIAEENGLIIPVGRWVLEQACVQCTAWRRNGNSLDISVNVSAIQLERREFVEEVRTALRDADLAPAALTLEITETVLMRKPDETACLLAELKALGIRIAVDDFGTGYSSLAYLRQFPVDSLKIDRTFITSLALSREAHALTHTLIQLGKALGLQTLAEGVEHDSQVQELQREGCDLAQGFLFARPLTPDAVERFLADDRLAARAG
jgi:diguanylate cyclase (GGDEF)-like protein